MSKIVAATRELSQAQFQFALLRGAHLEEQLRGAMDDFASYQATHPSVPLGPIKVKIVVEQEVA